jgi:arylsulfatase A-like enzyme
MRYSILIRAFKARIHAIGWFVFILTIAAFCHCSDKHPGKKSSLQTPNIILIYADDLGRGLLGTYGQRIITTPNIDKLVNEGMRFDNAYGSMLCAPARASLITGMHDCHAHEWNITSGGIYSRLDKELSLEEIKEKIHQVAQPAKSDDVFLGQVAQKAGYITAEFGKLEWGFSTTPERIKRHGWDYHFGYYDHVRCHGFYPPFLFENGHKVDLPGNTRADCGKSGEPETPEAYQERWNMDGKAIYSQTLIMKKLLAFIQNNNSQQTNKPFFIFFPTQLPHGPVAIPEVHPDFVANTNLTNIEKEYASMVKRLDDDVGRIYSKLQELKLLDNTIIIFTSDNGHEIYYAQEGRCSKSKIKNLAGERYDNITTKFYSELNGDVFNGNDGMAGLKRSNWEGGTRVPLVWYWKDNIKSGAVCNQLVSNYDFLNTLAELLGQKPVKGKDGISYANTLFGHPAKEHEYIIYASYMGPALVTKDGWKLRYFSKEKLFQLFYLPDDYREEKDLANIYPEEVNKWKKILIEECDGDLKNGNGGRFVTVK